MTTTKSLDRSRADDRPARSSGRGRLRAAGVAVGLLVAALVVSTVFAVVVLVVTSPDGATTATELVALGVASQLGLLVVGVVYVRRWLPGRVRVAVPSRRDLAVALLALVVSIVAATVLGAVVSRLFPDTGSVFDEVGATEPAALLALAVVSVLLVAPAEELLFRGAIQGRLRRSFGPAAAVVGASALFASVHLLNFTGPLAGGVAFAAVIGVVSLVLGWLYERTGNLAVPVLVHGLYNAVLFVAGYVSLAGL